ncbi:hypothetical protein [Burkholderia ubonensis]|uniref:hypothetical protein n=1 Tax=Burkholderia ubonensis TaxID=101571 RepID=UPI0012BA963F|nr:hypothetical protein [Burkholderia ubonensis]
MPLLNVVPCDVRLPASGPVAATRFELTAVAHCMDAGVDCSLVAAANLVEHRVQIVVVPQRDAPPNRLVRRKKFRRRTPSRTCIRPILTNMLGVTTPVDRHGVICVVGCQSAWEISDAVLGKMPTHLPALPIERDRSLEKK